MFFYDFYHVFAFFKYLLLYGETSTFTNFELREFIPIRKVNKMKKYYLLILVALLFSAGSSITYTQTNNVLLEFCTGTWCPWCPCGEFTAESILESYPNTMVFAYHGPANQDPYSIFNGNGIIGLLGLNAYPTGVIGRRTGIVNWSAWNNPVAIQSVTLQPGVSIAITKTYNASTHQLTVTADCTSLRQLDTACNINFVVTEDHIWCTQSNNGSCVQGSYLEHNWTVRNMVNGATGEVLSTGSWAANTVKSKSWTTTLDASWVDANCVGNVFVYFVNGALNNGSLVQQTKMQSVTQPTGITHNNEIPEKYSLTQNFPNPFNPTTNISFSLPKQTNVSLKIYDMTGAIVQNCIDGVVRAGIHNVQVDASSLSSGVYFYTLKTSDFMQTKKMILVK